MVWCKGEVGCMHGMRQGWGGMPAWCGVRVDGGRVLWNACMRWGKGGVGCLMGWGKGGVG